MKQIIACPTHECPTHEFHTIWMPCINVACPTHECDRSKAILALHNKAFLSSKAVPAFAQVNTYINEDLSRAYSSISNVIDHDQVDEGMLVAHGVCEELDTMKLDYQASAVPPWLGGAAPPRLGTAVV
eukprot:scaffold84185_cov19-Tisochrysis_lutea.AAC.1